MNNIKTLALVVSAITLGAIGSTASAAGHTAPKAKAAFTQGMDDKMMMKSFTSSVFKGVEVNAGTVTVTMEKGATYLEVSKDFMVPKTPAPSWQVVDTKGNVYLLNQLKIAGDKINTKIKLPGYITSIAKIQIWCSFAEVNLGEATFKSPVKVR